MNEPEWLACTDLHRLLEFLESRTSDRKLRLFSCACCRRIWDRLVELDRSFVEAAERIIDGVGADSDAKTVRQVTEKWHNPLTNAGRALGCLFHGRRSRTAAQIQWLLGERRSHDSLPPADGSELAAQLTLLRDIAGNPFRPVAFSRDWRSDTALALAQQMYETHDFSSMPILADALQDAGCAVTEMLEHCLGPTPHVRGCWVVDLLLGKG